jgi:hypothetical protein
VKARDTDLIETTNAHLGQLLVLGHDASRASVRVASASLRFLLVEGALNRAWKAAAIGGPIRLKTWCIIGGKGENVLAYCGGGDILPGIPFSACRGAELAEKWLNLSDVCRRPRIQVDAVKISTIEVIKYVANTLGGMHYDPEGKSPKSRKAPFDLLRRLESGELPGLPFEVNGRNLLHHEVLSIAQSVTRSPDVVQLRSLGPSRIA